MYIKQIIIEGFKSYREKIVVEPFAKQHNVVVGRNGAGKSNFFAAIQFVLSDKYSHLRLEQRQALLHEGAGARVVSAYVEIIFDNSDGRLPIEGKRVLLRRTIGLKNDQYYLNKRHVTFREVMSLLESAGFSPSNPYYIVQQGQINEIATAREARRVELIYEIAGGRVFNEKQADCEASLKDTERTMDKIDQLLGVVQERLSDLTRETESLQQYEQEDKHRRAIEYNLYKLELEEAQMKEQHANENIMCKIPAKLEKKLIDLQREFENLSHEMNTCKENKTQVEKKVNMVNKSKKNLLKEEANLNLKIEDMVNEILDDNKFRKETNNKLKKLHQTIEEKESQLKEIECVYVATKNKEEEYKNKIRVKQQRQKELLYTKQKHNQFLSREERDESIQSSLGKLEPKLKKNLEHQDRLTKELNIDLAQIDEHKCKIEEHTKELDKQKQRIKEYSNQVDILQKIKHKQHELWKKQDNISKALKIESERKRTFWIKMRIPLDMKYGIGSVNKVLATFDNRGNMEISRSYYGLLIDCFECDDVNCIAVNITAKKHLFYHIVESADVASAILKEIKLQKLPGEAIFIPLDIMYEASTSPECGGKPMLDIVKYDEKYVNVMGFVFSNTLLCENYETAKSVALDSGKNCVTNEGDWIVDKGPIRGGYCDSRNVALLNYKEYVSSKEKVRELDMELQILKNDLLKIGAEINKYNNIEIRRDEAKHSNKMSLQNIGLIKNRLSTIESNVAVKKNALIKCRDTLEDLQAEKNSLLNAVEMPLASKLSEAERIELAALHKEIMQMNKEKVGVLNERISLEKQKTELTNLLSSNIVLQRDEIQHKLQEIESTEKNTRLLEMQNQLKVFEREVQILITARAELETKTNKVNAELKRLHGRLNTNDIDIREAQMKINEHARNLAKEEMKQSLLKNKVVEIQNKIDNLSTLPNEDTISHYEKYSVQTLYKKLKVICNKLKKYTYVNKKALDMYNSVLAEERNFTKQRNDLATQREEIIAVMEKLQQEKDTALHFTIRQMKNYFSTTFKELVPCGIGELSVVQARGEIDIGNLEITGITVKVSFTSTTAETMKDMSSLSGGQKTLVALALIFAIQKCDPAPFYLFDEIDQALDEDHRKAVANKICKLSENAQFITTTFRRELLEHAHKWYAVSYANKVSHIASVDKHVAQDFIMDDPEIS